MNLFVQIFQICIIISVVNTTEGKVLISANMDDFKAIAKKFMSPQLAAKLSAMLSVHQQSFPHGIDDTKPLDNTEHPMLRHGVSPKKKKRFLDSINFDELVAKVQEKLMKLSSTSPEASALKIGTKHKEKAKNEDNKRRKRKRIRKAKSKTSLTANEDVEEPSKRMKKYRENYSDNGSKAVYTTKRYKNEDNVKVDEFDKTLNEQVRVKNKDYILYDEMSLTNKKHDSYEDYLKKVENFKTSRNNKLQRTTPVKNNINRNRPGKQSTNNYWDKIKASLKKKKKSTDLDYFGENEQRISNNDAKKETSSNYNNFRDDNKIISKVTEMDGNLYGNNENNIPNRSFNSNEKSVSDDKSSSIEDKVTKSNMKKPTFIDVDGYLEDKVSNTNKNQKDKFSFGGLDKKTQLNKSSKKINEHKDYRDDIEEKKNTVPEKKRYYFNFDNNSFDERNTFKDSKNKKTYSNNNDDENGMKQGSLTKSVLKKQVYDSGEEVRDFIKQLNFNNDNIGIKTDKPNRYEDNDSDRIKKHQGNKNKRKIDSNSDNEDTRISSSNKNKNPNSNENNSANRKKHFSNFNKKKLNNIRLSKIKMGSNEFEDDNNKQTNFDYDYTESPTIRPEEIEIQTQRLGDDNAKGPPKLKHTVRATRERFTMSSPNYYYNKLPKIVDKYNANEEIPENDRKPENIKYVGNPPASINGKVSFK